MSKEQDQAQETKTWEELSFQEKMDIIYTHKFRPMLVDKNNKYGDAALNPKDFLAIDPKSYSIIRSRLNEKLNRLHSLSNPAEDEVVDIKDQMAAIEDSLMDICGYWFLCEMEQMRLKLIAVAKLKKEQDNEG